MLCYSAHVMLQWSYYGMLQCSYYTNINLQACQNRRATFAPLYVSVDGMLGSEVEFLSRDWVTFGCKMGKVYPTACDGMGRTCLSFGIL